MKPVMLFVALACLVAACSPISSGPKPGAIVSSVPFKDEEQLAYSLIDDNHSVVGRGVLSVHADAGGLRLDERYEEATPPAGETPNTDTTTLILDASTLRPKSMERVVKGRAENHTYTATYTDDGKSVALVEDGGKPRTIQLSGTTYDNESSLWLWRTIAFADGYEARYISLDGVGKTRQTVDLTVTGRQTVEVPAGKFEAWRLQVKNGRATRVVWVNVDAPHQVVQWDNGSQVFKLEPSS